VTERVGSSTSALRVISADPRGAGGEPGLLAVAAAEAGADLGVEVLGHVAHRSGASGPRGTPYFFR